MVRRFELSIAQRLGLGFGAIFVLLAVQFGIVYARNQWISGLDHQVTDLVAPRAAAAVDLQNQTLREGITARGFALVRESEFLQRYQQAHQQRLAALSQLGNLSKDAESQALYNQIVPLSETWQQSMDRFVGLAQQGATDTDLATVEIAATGQNADLIDHIQALVDLQRRQQNQALAEVNTARAGNIQTLVILTGLVFLIGLGVALFTARAVRRPASRMVAATRGLAAGEYGPALALRAESRPGGAAEASHDELRVLAHALGEMAAGIQHRERRLAANRQVAAALGATIQVESTASEALRAIAEYTGCAFGAVYARDPETSTLRRVATYALDGAAESLALGEGIPGQAAAGGHMVVVRDIPADTPFRLRFGFDDLPPRTVVAVPLTVEENLIGVLLVGSLHDLGDEPLNFIEHVSHQVAVGLQNALAHRSITQLAAALTEKTLQLEAQNEELQAQQEELQSLGEELQAQNEELQAQNEELQVQGEELQILNGDLQHHREELLQSDRMKDEFLSIAAHELKTPVTSLKGFAQLLQRHLRGRPDLQEFSRYLGAIDQQADSLTARITRLLDASRAKMGRLEISPAPVDLATLVAQQVEQARARGGSHQLVLENSSDDLVGLWDGGRLEQVLGNLIDNALRYSPHGGEVRVSLSTVDGEARVAVRDSGIGIPAEALGRLFTPYFRDESARQVTADGMGIGLYISREIVTAHGGRISVESTVGEGTCFTVALPLSLEGQPAPSR